MGRPFWSWLLTICLAALLTVMAILQYRWIGEVSRADHERLRSAVGSATHRFADDLDREITDLYVAFLPRFGSSGTSVQNQLADRYQRWRDAARYPELVAAISVVAQDGATLQCLDLSSMDLESCDASQPMTDLVGRLGGRPPHPVDGGIPALVVPLDRFGFGRPLPAPSSRRPRIAVISLDLESMTGGVIPELVARHFGGLDCDVVIVDGERRDRAVFSSSPQTGDADVSDGDFETPILGVRIDPDMILERRQEAGSGQPRRRGMIGPRRHPPPRGPGDQPPFSENRPGARMDGSQNRGAGNAAWLLVVTHRAGSLEAAVSRLRRRNLGISGVILLLLAASVVMIVVSTRRAQWFARRQLEFVSGVSHELKTPLAAIRSAAENLAEGVVTEPAKVREYGELVDREGRRLGRMVGEILELAGMQGRHKDFPRGPVAVDQLLAGALADCRWLLESHEIEVVEDIPADLPEISGDREALRRAVVNLVDNAVKHGGRRSEVAIRAAVGAGGREVLLGVADRGPGIHRADLSHVFEPFYRGRSQAARAGGSGLGLSLVKHIVERHDGRVGIDTGRDGTEVTLHLPAVLPGKYVPDGEKNNRVG